MAAAYTLQEGDRASAASGTGFDSIKNACPDAIAWAVVLIVAVQEDDVACLLQLC